MAVAVVMFLLLLALPLVIWVIPILSPSADSLAQADAKVDLMATVYALSTAIAPKEGTVLAPGVVETAVAATLTEMANEFGGGGGLGSINPTLSSTPIYEETDLPPSSETTSSPMTTGGQTPPLKVTSTPTRTPSSYPPPG
ncbi:MAG TPA: hypothetical protein G4O11_00895 [Anaerolineae bacterium]|nr:hypothetical protein [Anaerolineae bacterium]